MAFTSTSLYNPLVNAASSQELLDSGTSPQDAMADYLTTGVASALVSGTVGIWNSILGVGNAFGGNYTYIDEKDAITSTLGAGAGQFYGRHKEGIDITGMLAATIVPGAIALKGIRLAQTRGILGAWAEVTTGARNADIVLGTEAVQTARATVLATDQFSLANKAVYGAYAAGLKQSAIEVVLSEIPVVVLNNQNATLNPEHLDAIDSIVNIEKEGLPFLAGAVGIGAAANAFKIRGFLRSSFDEKEADAALKGIGLDVEALAGRTAGDQFMLLSNGRQRLEDAAKEAGTDDPFIVRRANSVRNALDRRIDQAILDLNPNRNPEVTEILSGFARDVTRFNPEKAAEYVANLTGMKPFGGADIRLQEEFFGKTVAPMVMVPLREGEDEVKAFYTALDEFTQKAARGEVVAREGLLNTVTQYMRGLKNANGATLINSEEFQKLARSDKSPYAFIRVANTVNGQIDIIPATGFYLAEGTEAIERLTIAENRVRRALGLQEVTSQDRSRATLFHELSHFKSNSGAAQAELLAARMGEDPELLSEVFTLSQRQRPKAWDDVLSLFEQVTGESRAEFLTFLRGKGNVQILRELGIAPEYLVRTVELLADAGAQLVNPRTAEEAARLAPKAVALFNKYGALAMAWSPVRQYFNRRLGQNLTSVLPGANDLGKVTLDLKKGKIVSELHGKGIDTVDYKADFFRPERFTDATAEKIDYNEASKHWAAVFNTPVEQFRDVVGDFRATSQELAKLEHFAANVPEGSNFQIRNMATGKDEFWSREQIQQFLEQEKNAKRIELTGQARYNEQEIAHILNIDIEEAQGLKYPGWRMEKPRDFSKIENFVMEYSQENLPAIGTKVQSYSAVQMRDAVFGDIRERGVAEAMGEGYELMPDSFIDRMHTFRQTAARAGFLGAVRTEFGTFREAAVAVGRWTAQQIERLGQRTETWFSGHYSNFNHPNNYAARAELALVTNAAYRGWLTLRQLDDGRYVVFSKELLQDQTLANAVGKLDDIVSAATAEQLQGRIILSKLSGEFFRDHIRENAVKIGKKRALATSANAFAHYQDDVIYPPQRDLRKSKYFAFVVPRELHREADGTRTMVFGNTLEELEAKISFIEKEHGQTHKVVTAQDVTLHKQLQGEYEAGRVFNELEFDSSLARMGKTSEVAPNLDIYGSSTLDRYRDWHHRQDEAIVRKAVELKYAREIEAMRILDAEYSKFERSAVDHSILNKAKDTIYADTYKLMLDLRSFQGPLVHYWQQVGDGIGRAGSTVIDNIVRPFTRQKQITESEMLAMNKQLEEAGLPVPYRQLTDLVTNSPDVRQSRSAQLLVRTLNNLSATFMLSLDVANSIVQTLSTPILLMPIMREAKEALKGTDAGRRLDALTSVAGPAGKEPTSVKMMANAVRRYFTKDGKAFMEELQARGIITDVNRQYIEAMDFSEFTGLHRLKTLNDKIDKLRKFGGKVTQYQRSEEFSRYVVADCMRQICELRGMGQSEMFSAIGSAIDKVHGVYRGTQRAAIFNGVVGQAIGLYQTYFFNWMQNMSRHLQSRDGVAAAQQVALQSSLFGIRSLPGFALLNQAVGETNRNNTDIYSATGADSGEGGPAEWLLYGLGSHSLIMPIDFFSRGDMQIRNALVVPTRVSELPSVGLLSRVVGNMAQTIDLLTQDNVPAKQAWLHGLAHNGLNRPLQGLGQIMLGQVTSAQGTPYFINSNHIDYDAAQELNYAGMFARAIGTKPLNEAIMMDSFFRQKGYQATQHKNVEEVGLAVKAALSTGEELTQEMMADFLLQYERSGGDVENFNGFVARQMTAAESNQVLEFRQKLTEEGAAKRAYQRMLWERSQQPPWEDGQFEGLELPGQAEE